MSRVLESIHSSPLFANVASILPNVPRSRLQLPSSFWKKSVQPPRFVRTSLVKSDSNDRSFSQSLKWSLAITLNHISSNRVRWTSLVKFLYFVMEFEHGTGQPPSPKGKPPPADYYPLEFGQQEIGSSYWANSTMYSKNSFSRDAKFLEILTADSTNWQLVIDANSRATISKNSVDVRERCVSLGTAFRGTQNNFSIKVTNSDALGDF